MSVNNRPLLITMDQDLIDEVISIASSRAVDIQVESSLVTARRFWMSASTIVIGADVLPETHGASLPRRTSIVVVAIDDREETSERELWRSAVNVGAENVLVIPSCGEALGEALTQGREGPSRHGRLVTVSSGSGGAGASTIALALAQLAVKRGVKTVVIDGDPFGGGLDLLAGAEDDSGIRWSALVDAEGRVPAHALEAGLVQVAGISLLSFGRDDWATPEVAVAESVLATALRVFDLVIVDCGRDSFSAPFISRAHINVVVVRNHVRAAAAAASRIRFITRGLAETLILIARDAQGIDAESIARALGVRVGVNVGEASVLPFLPGMAMRADDGDGMGMPGALNEALTGLVDHMCAEDARAA